MLRKLFFLICFTAFGLNGLWAQETFKLMFYNLLNLPSQDVPSNRIQYLEIVLSDFQPDVFMVCELNNETASNDILTMMQTLNPAYSKAVFINNTSDDLTNDQNELQNLLFFDSTKFILESQATITTLFRDFNHYQLRLNTVEQTTNPTYNDVFSQSMFTQSELDGTMGEFDNCFNFIMTSTILESNTELKYIANSYKVYGNNADVFCFNREINSMDCSGQGYSFPIRNALYNFSDHLPVTLLLETSLSLNTNEFVLQHPIEFIGSNIIGNILKLKINNHTISNQTLNVYDSLNKLTKTINTKNSIYIDEDISNLASGIYHIILPQLNMNPLKFVITS